MESSARIRRPGALESRGMRRRDAGPRWEEDAEEEPRRGRRPTWRRAGGGPCKERREKPAEGEEPGVPKCRPLPASFRGKHFWLQAFFFLFFFSFARAVSFRTRIFGCWRESQNIKNHNTCDISKIYSDNRLEIKAHSHNTIIFFLCFALLEIRLTGAECYPDFRHLTDIKLRGPQRSNFNGEFLLACICSFYSNAVASMCMQALV